jgi:hypothetical protein
MPEEGYQDPIRPERIERAQMEVKELQPGRWVSLLLQDSMMVKNTGDEKQYHLIQSMIEFIAFKPNGMFVNIYPEIC